MQVQNSSRYRSPVTSFGGGVFPPPVDDVPAPPPKRSSFAGFDQSDSVELSNAAQQ